jgi:hypothetical protein
VIMENAWITTKGESAAAIASVPRSLNGLPLSPAVLNPVWFTPPRPHPRHPVLHITHDPEYHYDPENFYEAFL